MDREVAAAYLDALSLSQVAVEAVFDWRQTEAIGRHPDWDVRWWEREEAERERLYALCLQQFGREELLSRLSAATELAPHAIVQSAVDFAERCLVDNEAFARAAAGAATMALHAAALARLAGQGSEHVFMRKYALFESGRWPLGIVRNVFYLY